MKKVKRIAAMLLVVFMMFSVMTMPASAAGNHTDHIFTKEYYENSGGTPYISIWRGKWDYTPSYVYNYSSSGGELRAWVNSKPNSSYATRVDREYCGVKGGIAVPYNGPSKQVRVAKGVSKYLHNWCREDYYKYSGYSPVSYATTGDPLATLGYIMYTEGVKYTIAWSPDSV